MMSIIIITAHDWRLLQNYYYFIQLWNKIKQIQQSVKVQLLLELHMPLLPWGNAINDIIKPQTDIPGD